MKVGGPFAIHVFTGKKPRFKKKNFYRREKAAVKMSDVIKEMGDHVPERFLWHHIFLSAGMAVASLHYRAAVQAILFSSFRDMGHANFCLKISTKRQGSLFFYVTG